MKLTNEDLELIKRAEEIIAKNYDGVNYNHTVGAAVLCKSGKIYVGVNVYSLHGSCGEFTAIGTAVTNGEREFVKVVAVRGGEKFEILPPCGNCRQMLSDYAPECEVILSTEGEGLKVLAKELLPYAYVVQS